MKKTKLFLRGIATILLILALLAGFAGCRKTETGYTPGSINTTAENSGTDLAPIAKMVGATTYTTNDKVTYDTRAMLIAATRGYDMSASDFDDAKIELGVEKNLTEEEKLAIAKRVITAINEKASDANKVSADAIKGLNYADVESLVGAFRVAVDTEAGGNLLDKILCGIGKGLNWITNTLCFGSYVVGICLFAILIEILMIPFAIKQQKNSIKQASLRPKEMAIRKKYQGRNDQATMQKMQQEIQEFYQRENYSPYSGCLPLLLQLPIIMALYYIVINPLHYVLGLSNNISNALSLYYTTARAAGGLGGALTQRGGTIALLSSIRESGVEALEGLKTFKLFTNGGAVLEQISGVSDKIPNFNIGSLNLGLNPSFQNLKGGAWVLLFIPVLTFVAYFISAKLNRKFMPQPIANEGADKRQAACSNAMTDITMPAMSTVFTFWVPGVVGVYWIFRSLLTLLKSFIMSKVMPLPTFTKEDYDKAEKEMKGKKVVVKSENAGKVRSLHHIDDEDYDDTRDAALARKAAMEAEEAAKKADEKAPAVEAAPVKDESDKKSNEKKD